MLRMTLMAIAALALLGACGGGEPLDREAYIAEGDAICARMLEESTAIPRPASPEEVDAFLGEIVRIAEEGQADLGDLEPPIDGTEVHEALSRSLAEAIDKASAARAAAEAGDAGRAGALLEEAGAAGRAADDEAKAYGFRVCGSEDDLASEGG
jgi:hypothetical protein